VFCSSICSTAIGKINKVRLASAGINIDQNTAFVSRKLIKDNALGQERTTANVAALLIYALLRLFGFCR